MPEFQAKLPAARKASAVSTSGFSRNWIDPVDGDSVARLEQLAALDVAVAGLGASGLDAEGDQGRGIVLDHRDRGADGAQEGLGRLDDVIGGHDDHGAVGVFLADDPGGQADAGRRVARAGLGDDVLRRDSRELGAGGLGLVGTGDDQDALPGHQGLDPGHRLLEHRRVAVEAEQLLGPVAPALGPEPSAAASRHDDRVQHDTLLVLGVRAASRRPRGLT